MIYRYLLLPHPQNLLSMTPADSDVDDWSDVDSDSDEDEAGRILDIDMESNGTESEGTDTATPDDMDIDSEASSHRSSEHRSIAEEEMQDYVPSTRCPAILRTNRQIYQEASSLLYTEGVLVVEATDIFALANKPWSLEFGIAASDSCMCILVPSLCP